MDIELFLVLASKNAVAMYIHAQILVWLHFQFSWVYIPRSRIAESYGNSMFNLLRKCQAVSHGGYAILHSYQQQLRV
jgi:hypothetical protein